MADSSGNVRDILQYGAFGNITSQMEFASGGTGPASEGLTCAWTPLYTYAGMQLDQATGLYYNGARYIAQAWGGLLVKTLWD